MGIKGQTLALWCGPAFIVLFFVGFWVCAGFVPPLSPALGASEVVAYYEHHGTGIRLGMVIAMASTGLLAPWVGLITVQMLRIRAASPLLAYAQLGAGCAGLLLFILPTLLWEAAAFRPERDPQFILLLNDLAWIIFIVPFTLAVIQNLMLAAAILLDQEERPVFPRWLGYFNIWVALLFVPGSVAVFFKVGPFAWDGLFPWWIPFLTFGLWFVVMFIELRKVVLHQGTGHRPLDICRY